MGNTDDPAEFLAQMEDAEERLYTAIGQFSVYFAVLERHINWAIGYFLHVSEHQRDIVVNEIQNLRRRLDILEELGHLTIKDEAQRAEFVEIIKAAREANEERNNIIHNPWGAYVPLDDAFQKIRKNIRKGKLKFKHRDYTPNQIRELAVGMIKTVSKLMKLITTIKP